MNSPKMKPHNPSQREYARGYYAAHGFRLMHDGAVVTITGRKVAIHIACEFSSINGNTSVNISYRPSEHSLMPLEKITYQSIKE